MKTRWGRRRAGELREDALRQLARAIGEWASDGGELLGGGMGNGVRRFFTAWLGSRGENGAGKARLCLRGREEARPHAAELGGVLGQGLGEEGGGGRVRRRLGVDLIVEWRGAGACLSALGCVEAGARR